MREDIKKALEKEETEDDFPDISMKWFGLYRLLLLLGTVVALLCGGLSVYIGITKSQGDRTMLLICIGIAVLGILWALVSIFLFKKLKSFRFFPYLVNKLFIFVLSIFGAALGGVGVAAGMALKLGLLKTIGLGAGAALVGLIYPLFNALYFSGRKHLFTEGEKYGSTKATLIVHGVFHVLVSAAIIVLAFMYIPEDWLSKIDFADFGLQFKQEQEDETPELTEEEIAAAEAAEAERLAIRENFDEISLYLGYKDADAFMSEIERTEAAEYNNVIDLHAMDQKDAYVFIFVEYYALSSFEEALMATNPYNNEVIYDFQDYQEYVMDGIKDYYKYFN